MVLMKTTKTFENASLISVVDGVITIKAETGRNHTFKRSSLISLLMVLLLLKQMKTTQS